MRIKRIIIAVALLSTTALIATSVPVSVNFSKVKSLGEPRELTTDITPTKPGKGETVSFLPESLSKFWQMDDLLNTYTSKAQDIGELTPYNQRLHHRRCRR